MVANNDSPNATFVLLSKGESWNSSCPQPPLRVWIFSLEEALLMPSTSPSALSRKQDPTADASMPSGRLETALSWLCCKGKDDSGGLEEVFFPSLSAAQFPNPFTKHYLVQAELFFHFQVQWNLEGGWLWERCRWLTASTLSHVARVSGVPAWAVTKTRWAGRLRPSQNQTH